MVNSTFTVTFLWKGQTETETELHSSMFSYFHQISRMLTEPTPNELPALLQGKKEELTTPVEGDEDEESQDFFLVKPDSPVRTLSSSVTYVTCQMNEINMQNDVWVAM